MRNTYITCWSLDAPHESWRACQINNITPSEEENIFNHMGECLEAFCPGHELLYMINQRVSHCFLRLGDSLNELEASSVKLCEDLEIDLHCQGPEAEWGQQCLGCPRSL